MPSAARPRKAIILGAGGVALASPRPSRSTSSSSARPRSSSRRCASSSRRPRRRPPSPRRCSRPIRRRAASGTCGRRGLAALHYIEQAEGEAPKIVARPSAGAAALRRAYASALTVIGNELVKADLRDLAVTKYKEALLFLPDDADLQAKAELSLEERRRRARDDKRAPAPRRAPPRADDGEGDGGARLRRGDARAPVRGAPRAQEPRRRSTRRRAGGAPGRRPARARRAAPGRRARRRARARCTRS